MRRGRVELKRIENKINRQATFAKRRNGLTKKAQELSVLCEVEVALIIFSSRGKLFDFCSSPCMFKTLEKYKKGYHHTSSDVTVPSKDTQLDNYQEYLMLRAEVECLQRSHRNLLGTDLGSLSTKELGQLEDQVEMSLQQIRSKKTQLLLDNWYDLTRKEQMLQDANKALQIKLIEATSANTFQSQSFLPPSECEPYLQFGNHQVCVQDLNNGINVQGWMIQNQIP